MAGLLAEASGLELVGATVEMDLPELGAVGPALVVDLKPCPAIPARPGQVITATFKHASADVMDLVLSDYPVATPHSGLSVLNPPTADPTSSPETIGVTGNHPFWSVDRAEFVQAGELAIGERLQTLAGDIRWVQQKLPRPGPEPVYNLEVQGEHVYYVGDSGVLAHNVCPSDSAHNAANAAKLNRHLKYLEDYGSAGFKDLANGRIRYYGRITPASKTGTISGRRTVHEWDPSSGRTRTWMESLDHQGRVRIVRPETGGPKIHYLFDENRNFIGTF